MTITYPVLKVFAYLSWNMFYVSVLVKVSVYCTSEIKFKLIKLICKQILKSSLRVLQRRRILYTASFRRIYQWLVCILKVALNYYSKGHKSSFLVAMNLLLHGFSCRFFVTKLCTVAVFTYPGVSSLSRYYGILKLTIFCPCMHQSEKNLTVINFYSS